MSGNQREMQRRERREKKDKRNKLIIWIGIGIVFVLLVVLKICEININSVKDYFTDENGNFSVTDGVTEDNFPYSIDASQDVNIVNLNNRLGILTPNSFTVLDGKKANVDYFFEHGYSNPILAASGIYSLVYDQGDNNYRLDTVSEAVYEEESPNAIFCADVSKTGVVALATTSKDKLCDITVLSKSLDEKFNVSLSDGFVVDIAISDNSKQVSAAVVNSVDAQLVTKVYTYDINSDGTVFKEVVLPASTLVDINCVGNDIWAVGSDYLGIIKGDEYKEIYTHGSINTECYSYNQSEELVLAYGDYNNSTDYVVSYIKPSGKIKNEINVNALVKDVCATTSVISVLTTDEIINYNLKNGKEKSRLSTTDSVKSICVLGSQVYIHKQSIIDKGGNVN